MTSISVCVAIALHHGNVSLLIFLFYLISVWIFPFLREVHNFISSPAMLLASVTGISFTAISRYIPPFPHLSVLAA